MKQKTTLLKMILAATMMLGVSSAWADTSTIYNWGTTTDGGATVWTDAEKSNWGSNASLNTTYGLGVSNSSSGTISAARTLTDIDGTAILTYTAKWHVIVGYSKDNYALLSLGNYVSIKVGGDQKLYVITNGEESEGGTLSLYKDDKKYSTTVNVNCTVNTVTNKITALTIGDSISTKYTASSAIVMDGARTSNTVTLSKTASGNRLISSQLKSLKIVQETQSLSKYGYTIKYMTDVEDDATTVKTVDMTEEEDKVYDGSWVYIDSSPFTESETKYYFADDATTLFSITSDNQVCKVKVRRADTWNWTIKGRIQTVGTDLGVVNSGTVIEEETVTGAYFKNMLLYEYKLYKKDAISNNFQVTFTPASDNYVQQYDYSPTDYDNVILLKEAEDVATLTQPDNYHLGSRMSGGKGAYADGADAEVLSLPAGTYKLSAKVIRDANSFVFYYGDNTTVLTATAGAITTGDEFTLNSTTPIKLKKGVKTAKDGYSKACLDYFFVQQTAGGIQAVDNLGYTYSCPVPLDFSGTSVRAYIATYDSERDVMRLTNVTKVPANTGVLIFSDSEMTNQSIPVCATTPDNVDNNCLKPVSEAMTLTAAEGDNENYVLAIEEGKAVFQLVSETSASMTAGQAYLQIPKRTGEGARSLRIVFDDETTGVTDVRSKMSEVRGEYYNLSGQRVVQPTKGLYIVNGKKVIVK